MQVTIKIAIPGHVMNRSDIADNRQHPMLIDGLRAVVVCPKRQEHTAYIDL